jgi:uncharacterized protein (TIGR02300 family)
VKHLNFSPALGIRTVAKPELGTKRLCANCSAKFYDLNKNPIVCPKCHTTMELSAAPSRPTRPEPAAAAAPVARAPAPVAEETLVPETPDAEFVSLEDADAEAQGKKGADADADVAATDGEDIEIDATLDDAALIEEQEESDEDVTDIIGERENEEEP